MLIQFPIIKQYGNLTALLHMVFEPHTAFTALNQSDKRIMPICMQPIIFVKLSACVRLCVCVFVCLSFKFTYSSRFAKSISTVKWQRKFVHLCGSFVCISVEFEIELENSMPSKSNQIKSFHFSTINIPLYSNDNSISSVHEFLFHQSHFKICILNGKSI